jgi:O-acetyl-ADP-ribose deacetylase (regulator of RNase III)
MSAGVCHIHIVDTNEALVERLRSEISDTMDVEIACGDARDSEAGAIVSPGNSWGIMDGGFDGAVAFKWPAIEAAVRAEIDKLPFGELLVGRSVTVPTGDERLPHLIYTPTMRGPGPIYDPTLVMLAVRSAVMLALALGCRTLVMPGMGTGTGRLPPELAAAAMVGGIQAARFPKGRPASAAEATARHFNCNG